MRMRCFALGLALSVFGCDKELIGLPRIHVMATSHDGRYAALVRNHPTIDGPSQTLHIRDNAVGTETKILQLGEASQWCNRIVWEKDSSSVIFVIEGTASYFNRVRVVPKTGKYTHEP